MSAASNQGCPDCLPTPHQGGDGHCECDCHDERVGDWPVVRKRSDIPTERVLALIPVASEDIFDAPAFCQERGWPWKVFQRWLEQQADEGTIEYGVSLNYVWRTSR